jgi:hypothetical protein
VADDGLAILWFHNPRTGLIQHLGGAASPIRLALLRWWGLLRRDFLEGIDKRRRGLVSCMRKALMETSSRSRWSAASCRWWEGSLPDL